MAHYQYFIKPISPLANTRLREISSVELHSESDNLFFMPDFNSITTIFCAQSDTQGTGGRASQQPITFELWRRLGVDGQLRKMTELQIEAFMRSRLHLKPQYLQAGGKLAIAI